VSALEARLDVGTTGRKALAELLGSALLAATVVGSGIAAQRLSPDEPGLQLLQNSLVTGAVLVALILALGPVSAAFNPVITLAERALGVVTSAQAALYVAVQVVGCCVGVVLANLMFELDAVSVSGTERAGGGLWLGEVVATSASSWWSSGWCGPGARAPSPSPSPAGSPPPTGPPARRASPTPPSPSAGRCRTPSPASPRRRRRCSSSCSCSAEPSGCSPPSSLYPATTQAAARLTWLTRLDPEEAP
jgi:hypothetical protein